MSFASARAKRDANGGNVQPVGSTVGRSVPTFHRLNSETISYRANVAAEKRLSERRSIPPSSFSIDG